MRGADHGLSGGGSHAFDWVRTTKAGTFWSKLNAVDFMNSSLQFAALAVVCLFPFLITVSAESGGDARHALIARLGLDERAAGRMWDDRRPQPTADPEEPPAVVAK
jgi:hypothetical protein